MLRIGARVQNTLGTYLGRISAVRRLTVYVVNGSTFTRDALRPAKEKRRARKRKSR